VPVEFEKFNVSGNTSQDAALFKRSMDSLRRNKVGLKGILYTPVERSEHTSWNVAMRQQLDIYASVVLCKTVPGVPTRHRDVDFAIIRENTEGEYSGLEHQSSPGVVESLKIMTAYKSERIARFAFDFAIKNGRKVRGARSLSLFGFDATLADDLSPLQHVTAVHKANIMKLGDGLFLNTCRRIAEEYKDSGITFSDMMCVRSPFFTFNTSLHTQVLTGMWGWGKPTKRQRRQHLDAAREPPSAVRRHGHAEPVRLDREQHWRRPRRRTGYRPRRQHWQGIRPVRTRLVRTHFLSLFLALLSFECLWELPWLIFLNKTPFLTRARARAAVTSPRTSRARTSQIPPPWSSPPPWCVHPTALLWGGGMNLAFWERI
jgi:hypothetical protein